MFAEAPNRYRPPCIKKVMHKDQEPATETDAQEEHERLQPREGEFLHVNDGPDNADHGPDCHEHEREIAIFRQIQRRLFSCLFVVTHTHFFRPPRKSCGTSSTLPNLANCNARKYAMIAQRSSTVTFGPYAPIRL